ncbi:hypothetical protein [Streptosporangium sp. NPDC003464]
MRSKLDPARPPSPPSTSDRPSTGGPVTYRRCLKLTHAEPAGEQLELFPDLDQAPAEGAAGGGA